MECIWHFNFSNRFPLCCCITLSLSEETSRPSPPSLSLILLLPLSCDIPHLPILPPFTLLHSLPHTHPPLLTQLKTRQWRCASLALSGPISLCLPHCTAHQGLQRRLLQLKAAPELQWSAWHTSCRRATSSELARGNFNGVDTKYEHQVERVTKPRQRYFWDADVFQLGTSGFWDCINLPAVKF